VNRGEARCGPAAPDWDAGTYDRISAPQQRWAAELLDGVELADDASVLDAGCGSGRVTLELCERVPRGRVYAVDAAPSMAAHAERLLGDRASVLCQDLTALTLPEPVDLIFSNATFHWITDHTALFEALQRNLRPGGRLIAQCGGCGNIESVRAGAERVMAQEPFAPHFARWPRPWNYSGAEEAAERLRDAGFDEIETWLQERPTPIEDGRRFLESVCLVRHLDPLPPALRDPFIDDVLAQLREPLVLDYVRLNLRARGA
jgi:trans-aconitate 2-methyltransferase